MAYREENRTNVLKRILGVEVQIEASRDGIQRGEWLSIDGECIGTIHTSRWDANVWGNRPRTVGGEAIRRITDKGTHGSVSKDQAFTALRKLLVSEWAARRAAKARPIFVGYGAGHDLNGWYHSVRIVSEHGADHCSAEFTRKPDALGWLKDRGASAEQLALVARLMKAREDGRIIRPDGTFTNR